MLRAAALAGLAAVRRLVENTAKTVMIETTATNKIVLLIFMVNARLALHGNFGETLVRF